MNSLDSISESVRLEPEQANYKFVLYKYAKYWYLFVLSLLLALGTAYLIIRYAIPEYNITSSIVIKESKDTIDPSSAAAFNDISLLSSRKNIDNEVVFFKSVSLMQKVMAELSLETTYYVKGRVNNVELYKGDVPYKLIIAKLNKHAFNKVIVIRAKGKNSFDLEDGQFHGTYQFGQSIQKPYAVFTVVASPNDSARSNKPLLVRFNDIHKLGSEYAKKLSVTTVSKQASIVNLSLTDAVPEKGKDILNKLVEVYNKDAVEDKNLIAANTLQFIDTRLKYLGAELSTVEKGVENFKRKNEVADVTSQVSQSLEEAGVYNKQLAEARNQIEVLESIEAYVSDQQNQQKLIPNILAIQDPTLAGLISKFNELQLDHERLLRTNLPSNPVVESANEQLANLRTSIQDNLQNVRQSLTITSRNLQIKSGQFGSKIQRVPTIERGLLEINRQQEIKRTLYLYLLQKREEAALSLAATVSNSRIIDPATVGDYPVSPNKMSIALIALILGFGLPFAFVYLNEMMNDKLQEPHDLTYLTNIPKLGDLAYNKDNNGVVITKELRSPVAEMLRLIRTNFLFVTEEHSNKVILVTSSISGEGKTFFSINLGASLVLTGKKVIVVNFDLRKSNLAASTTFSNDEGVVNYLTQGDITVDDIIKPSQIMPDLYTIGAGSTPINPAELMMDSKVGKLLRVLKENFDYVIIDTAPVGQVADAFALAPYIDCTIYMVRCNYTPKAQLSIPNNIYKNNRLKNLMLVVNAAKVSTTYGYGYGYNESGTRKKKNHLV